MFIFDDPKQDTNKPHDEGGSWITMRRVFISFRALNKNEELEPFTSFKWLIIVLVTRSVFSHECLLKSLIMSFRCFNQLSHINWKANSLQQLAGDQRPRLESDFYFYHKNLCNEHKVHNKRVTRTRKPVAEQMKLIKRCRWVILLKSRDDESRTKTKLHRQLRLSFSLCLSSIDSRFCLSFVQVNEEQQSASENSHERQKPRANKKHSNHSWNRKLNEY